ncbi:MLO-like protein 1 isoform X2 [Iris pallida]|uniref:MLO-like protein n=1 Tax=Iris pallida TaxID=29817 RepID=A0AAX6E319_IRIPA|nr:MLO-like protein 1 isoform X2 [Iris pallida]
MAEEAVVQEIKFEFTPTWIVAVVCSVIVFISLLAERQLHFLGKFFKRKNQKALYEALQKVKEELMLLGFISLLLTVFQGLIQKICIPKGWTNSMLPCEKDEEEAAIVAAATAHYVVASFIGSRRRLLSGGGSEDDHCSSKGKVPLLSIEALHQLHIFIFVLAITHVIFSVLTMLLGGLRITRWKKWEESIQRENTGSVPQKITHVHQFEFIQDRFHGTGKDTVILSWLKSFCKQFYGSVTQSDYTTMRLGFIMEHCKSNPKFDFHKYMLRALEADFKKVVGIRWYLWIFVIIFLLLNIHGWHTYFWIAFLPLILLLALGTKLEHIFTQLAHEVAEKHSAIQGDLVVKPSDEHFWFHRPRILLHVIHFILFQNAFEIAFLSWTVTTYSFHSCMMEKLGFTITRIFLGVMIQILCSLNTLPLYALVTQMGSSFKNAIFDEHVQESLVGWAQKVKRRQRTAIGNRTSSVELRDRSPPPPTEVQTQPLMDQQDILMEEGKAGSARLSGEHSAAS